MEGDAGTSRLNPTDAEDSSRTEVKAEDSPESDAGTDQLTTEIDTEDSAEPEATAEDVTTERNPEDSPETAPIGESAVGAGATVARGPSRLGRGWVASIVALLLLAAGGLGFGGYLALRSHHQSQVIARNNAAALEAAKACVAATQAPDTNTMAQSEQKIIDCGTDEYRSQALLYTSMLVQAYQAANVHVQVTDERAAVERTHKDGSVDILVALRVKVSNSTAQNQEAGYRLRVRMLPVDGQYKIAKLDTVTTPEQAKK